MNQQLFNILNQADYTNLSDADAAAKLNTPIVATTPYFVTYRTLASIDLAAADAVMAALRQSHPDIATLLMQAGPTDGSAGGVDVSLPATQAMIDQFAAGGVITAAQATTIKSLGTTSTYPAGAAVTVADVTKARAIMARQAALASQYNADVQQVQTFMDSTDTTPPWGGS